MKLREERWRNKALWVSIAALLFMALQDFGIEIPPGRFNEYTNLVFYILLALGIINDPNEGQWYDDDIG